VADCTTAPSADQVFVRRRNLASAREPQRAPAQPNRGKRTELRARRKAKRPAEGDIAFTTSYWRSTSPAKGGYNAAIIVYRLRVERWIHSRIPECCDNYVMVHSRSLTLTYPRSVSSTPASSRFSPSVLGVRPVATNARVPFETLSIPFCSMTILTESPDLPDTRLIRAFRRKSMPSSASRLVDEP
jgi:hypothetical protein